MRRSGAVVVLAVLAFAFGAPSPASAGSVWCAAPTAPPCVVSATRNGSTVNEASTDYDIQLSPLSSGGSNEVLWNVWNETAGSYDLGSAALADTWVVTIDVGAFTPRVVFTRGEDVEIVRSGSQVTITAHPISPTDGCDTSSWPWTCSSTATNQWDGYLDGHITDYGAWEDVPQREAMNGMNYNTNIDAVSLPPEIEEDPATGQQRLLIRLANSHFRTNGTTVFLGFGHLRIPNLFLRRVYGIDDPSTLTGTGLAPSVSGGAGGGTITVTQEPGDTAMLVDFEGMTFSTRLIRIRRGIITPSRPRALRAKRVSAHRGTLRFDLARPRGSKITGYRGRCASRSDVEAVTGLKSPLVVAGLMPGVAYSCSVRARAKAGAGKWSTSDRLAANP